MYWLGVWRGGLAWEREGLEESGRRSRKMVAGVDEGRLENATASKPGS